MALDRLAQETQNREELLKKQFASARTRLGGQKREVNRQSKRGLNRLAAVSGQTGGAIAKAEQKQIRDIGQQFGEVESGLEGQQAAAMDQLREAESAKRFSREERLGSEEFAAGEAKKHLDFQKNSWADQMQFQWAEFDENKRTNFINASIALNDAGIKSPADWSRFGDALISMFPGQRNPASSYFNAVGGTPEQGRQLNESVNRM